MKTRGSLSIVPVMLLALLPATGATLVRMNGSETMQQFGKRLTAWYTNKNPSVQFQIAAFQPTASFAAMAAGDVDIVQSSRKVLHSEAEALHARQRKGYVEVHVATEIAGIAVNQTNPVRELSLFQLRQVLSGSVKNWKQVGGADAPIDLYGRDDSSGVRAFLEEEFMGDEGIASSVKTFPTNSGVLAAAGHDANAIGYGSVEPTQDAHVRYLAIKPSANADGVAPTGDAIRAGRYKLVRPLYFYFAGPPKGDLLRFAEWVLSAEGQLVVEAVGYYPLGAAEREEGRKIIEDEKPKK